MSKAKRDNSKKPKLGYILQFPRALEMLARVMEYGGAKYGDCNWQLGGKPDGEYIDAALRHYTASAKGFHDPESKCSHLGHVLWNILALIEMNYPDMPPTDEGFGDACEAAESKRLHGDVSKLPALEKTPFPNPYRDDRPASPTGGPGF
jgi:hypothetical protein